MHKLLRIKKGNRAGTTDVNHKVSPSFAAAENFRGECEKIEHYA